MLIPMLLLSPQALATSTTPQPVEFPTVCPPDHRPCIRHIRCADGIDFDLDWLRDFADLSLVVAATDDLQLAVLGETGGLYGYDGDGGKYAARLGVSLRVVPGAAKSWLWY